MIPILFFPVIEKTLQQFLSASFLDVTEIDENKIVTDFLRRRYPAGAAYTHPNVASEKPGAAALFWLPSAAGTSHLKGSKSSCQNRSFFCGCCPDAAQMSNSLVLIPAGQQRLICIWWMPCKGRGEGKHGQASGLYCFIVHSTLTCVLAINGWLVTVLFLFQW